MVSNPAIGSIIDKPREAEFKRELLTWRTPHLGYVEMYINPKMLRIEDRKDISTARTKGGFVIQYAGEALTVITLSGNTGSSGIEGINILHSVYRAEQEAFEGVAIALDERLSAMQFDTVLNSINIGARFDLTLGALDSVRGNGRPMPTLASLATNIELFFQGVLYRGYFKSMSVDENGDNAGIFNYSITFEAYGKQGVRRNFTAWHKQPYLPVNAGGSNVNPHSFSGLTEPTEVTTVSNLFTETPIQQASEQETDAQAQRRRQNIGLQNENLSFASRNGVGRSARVTITATDIRGRNIRGSDLTRGIG